MWIDLKCRELRIIKEAVAPHDYLELNHNLEVEVPTAVFYNEGNDFILIEEIIDGNRLKIKFPDNYTGTEEIKFGMGASINIPDKTLGSVIPVIFPLVRKLSGLSSVRLSI